MEKDNYNDDIRKKLEEVESILSYLENVYGSDFFLCFANFKNNFRYSKHSTPTNLVRNEMFFKFLKNQVLLKSIAFERIEQLIKEGYFIVNCINNSNKPNHPMFSENWLVLNEYYIVGKILVDKDGSVYYNLKTNKNVDIDFPFDSKRFVKVYVNDHLN